VVVFLPMGQPKRRLGEQFAAVMNISLELAQPELRISLGAAGDAPMNARQVC
jgi:hypothetical protein